MKTAVIIILAVLLTWYVATFGIPFSCDIPLPPLEPPPPPEIKPEVTLEDIEWRVFDLINERRETEGLLVLIWDRTLYDQAKEHSEWMITTQNYKHSNFNVFENIYWGINISPNRLAQDCFEAWMKSPRHKENILEPSIRYGAVGIASDGTSTFATFMAK